METAAAIHPTAKQNGGSPALSVDNPSAGYLNYDDDSDYGPETDVDRMDEFHPTEQKRDLEQEHSEDGIKKPKLEEEEIAEEDDFKNQPFEDIDINGNGSVHHDEDLPEVAKQVDDLGASDAAEKVFGQLEENKSFAGNHRVVHDSISEESETEDEEEVDWKYVKGDKEEKEIKEERSNTKESSFDLPASSDGGESGDEDMEYNLNPDAAEFVPLSPTSGCSTSNSITAPLSPPAHRDFIEEMHRSHLLNEDDRIVSSSPMKGEERSIDDVDVPSLDDFQSEICRRPSDITPNFVAENVTTPIKRDIFDSTFDKTSDTLLGASTKAVYGDDSDCANLSDFGKSLNGDEYVKLNGDDAHGVSEKELSNYEASDEKETASSGKEEDISPENSASVSLSGEDIRGEGGLDQNGSSSRHPILDFGTASGSTLQHSDNEVASNVFCSNPFGNNVGSPFQENSGESASQIFGIDSNFSPEQQEKGLSEEQEKEVGEENCGQKEDVDFFRLDTGFNNAPDFSFGNQENTTECFAKQLNDFGSSLDRVGSDNRSDKNDVVEPEQISESVSVLSVQPTGDSNPFEEHSGHLKASDSVHDAERSFSSARNKEWKKSVEDFSASFDAENPPALFTVDSDKHHLKDLVLGSTEDLCTSFDAEAPYVHDCSHSKGHKEHHDESLGTQEKEQSGSSVEGRCTSFDAVTPYIHECSDHHSHDLYADHKPSEEMNTTSLRPDLSSPHFATEQKEFIEEGVLDEKENSLPLNVVNDISPGMSSSCSTESVKENGNAEAEIDVTGSKGLEEDRNIASKPEEGIKTADVGETSPVVEVPKLGENVEMSGTEHDEDTPRISTPPPTPAAVDEEEESKGLNQESLQSFVESPKVSALGIEATEASIAPLEENSDNKTVATAVFAAAAVATTAAVATGAVLAAKTESKKIASKPSIKKAEADKAKPSKPAPKTTPSPAQKVPAKLGKPSTPSTSILRKAPSPATKPTATKSAPRPASASSAKPPVTKNVPSRISAAGSGRPKSAEPAATAAKPISKILSAPRTRPVSATVASKPATTNGKPALNGDVSKSTPKVSSIIKKSPLSKTPVSPKPPAAAAKPSPKPAVSLTSRTSLAPALKPKSPVVASKATPSASKPKVAPTNVLAPKKPSLTASAEKKAPPPRKPLMRPATRPAAEAPKPVKKMAGSATAVAIRKPASYINQMKNGEVKTNGEVLADTKENDVEAVK